MPQILKLSKPPTPPAWLSIGLAVVAGVLSVLNLTMFGFGFPWQTYVTVGLAVLAALGISPLTGARLQVILHISHALALALASVITTVIVTITTLSIDQTLKGIIVGILTLLAGVLFGPSIPTPAPLPAPARKRRTPIPSVKKRQTPIPAASSVKKRRTG